MTRKLYLLGNFIIKVLDQYGFSLLKTIFLSPGTKINSLKIILMRLGTYDFKYAFNFPHDTLFIELLEF